MRITWRLILVKLSTSIFKQQKIVLNFDYKVDGVQLTKVDSYEYLGVILSSGLGWNRHVEYVKKRVANKLWYLKRTLGKSPPSVKIIAYKSIIRPVLEYASAVWSPWQTSRVKELEDIQTLAARVIFFLDSRWSTSVTGLRWRANLHPLANRRACQQVKLFFQIFKNNIKIDSPKYLKPRGSFSEYLHYSKTVAPINARINSHKQSVFEHTIDLWNSLPGDVADNDPFSSFEKAVEIVFQC